MHAPRATRGHGSSSRKPAWRRVVSAASRPPPSSSPSPPSSTPPSSTPPSSTPPSSSSSSQQPIPPQPQYWYDQPHPQQLREALQLPSWRFQTLINQAPAILSYQPQTLRLTLDALAAALHVSPKDVVAIIEQRPDLLLQPQDAVKALTALAQVLGRSTQQTSFLLLPHRETQLLAMRPEQLQQHMQQVCEIMHWAPAQQQDLQQGEAATITAAAAAAVAAAEAVGPACFVQLLAAPVAQTAARIQDLSTALDAPGAVAAQLVQHHPVLLNMSPAVLRSRLHAVVLAAAASGDGSSSSCAQLLASLDAQQLRGLSGLLLLSPHRLTAQLQGLQAMLVGLKQQPQQAAASQATTTTGPTSSSDLAARLLLRLGTRVSLADAQVKLVALQGLARRVQPWQQQLCGADDKQLAALLAADHEGLAQAQYLASSECALAEQASLLEAVLMPAREFTKRWPGYTVWLSAAAGGGSGGSSVTPPP